jgi:hypothetical protein
MQAKQQLDPGSPKGEKRAVAPGHRPTATACPADVYVCRGRPLLHPAWLAFFVTQPILNATVIHFQGTGGGHGSKEPLQDVSQQLLTCNAFVR